MKHNERGIATLELMLSIALIALIGIGTATTTFQVINVTGRSNAHMTVVRQVENASYWIGYDSQMAESIATDNLTSPDFLVLTWTEHDYIADEATYHSVRYFFADLADGIGKLKRNHWSSAGANENTLVADNIYYNLSDTENTSKASYQDRILTVQLTSIFGDTTERNEYRTTRRPDIN